MKLAIALLTRSREAPTMPASSSWVTGSMNWSLPSASSSRRFAVRPVTSRNTESASCLVHRPQALGEQAGDVPQQARLLVEHLQHRLVRNRQHADGSSARAIAERGRSSSMPSSPNRSPGSIRATTLSRRSIGLAMAMAMRPRVTTYSASGGSPSSKRTSPRTMLAFGADAASGSRARASASAKKSVSARTSREAA